MSPWERRVLLVEDDPFAVTLLTSVLTERGFKVKSCDNAAAAREEARAFDPDVAILDIHLRGEPMGIQIGYLLEKTHPQIALMYLTRYPAAIVGDKSHREHVRGRVVLDKDEIAEPGILIDAVESALRGRKAAAPKVDDGGIVKLTAIQLSVLGLMAEGLTNTAIANRRGTSERAVEKLIEAIYITLGIEARGERNARVLAALKYSEVMGLRRLPSDESQS